MPVNVAGPPEEPQGLPAQRSPPTTAFRGTRGSATGRSETAYLVVTRRRLTYTLLVSLLIHALLLSLTFGGQGLWLPGLGFPWEERRVEVPELRVVVVPAQVAAAEPAATPVAEPLPRASIEPPVANGPAPTSSVSRAPAAQPAATAIVPEANLRAGANPTADVATGTAAAKTPVPADQSSDTTPPAISAPAVIAVERTDEPTWVVPIPPAMPMPDITPAPSASNPENAMPSLRDTGDAAPARTNQKAAKRGSELAKLDPSKQEGRLQPEELDAVRPAAALQEAARAENARLEVERQEAARVEAARVEAARVEAARVEAAKVAAAQVEAVQVEAARVEAARVEAARAEAARAEAAKVEASRAEAARVEAARAEVARVEAARIEAAKVAAAQVEAAQVEATRVEAARVEAAKVAAAQVEAAQVEATRVEAARVEAAKVAAAQVEAAQVEAAQVEAARVEAARVEAARVEASKFAAAQAEAARAEVARVEASRAEAARVEAARVEAARAEAARAEVARVEAAKVEAAKAEAARIEGAKADAARAEVAQEAAARREAALRAIGRQLDEEAARREAEMAAARLPPSLAPSSSSVRRYRLFGRADPNAEVILYAEAWSRKIQLNMTFDMVREAAKQPHTDPLVTVAIRSDGSVESVTFVQSSGVAALDEAIRRIVRSQAPYQVFPPGLASQYDVIEIRRTWYFDMAIRLY